LSPRIRFLFTTFAALALAAPALAAPQRADPLLKLRRWNEQFQRPTAPITADDEAALDAILSDARLVPIAEPDRKQETVAALLDLAGLQRAEPPRASSLAQLALERVRQKGRAVVEVQLERDRDGSLAHWMAANVLALPRVHPLERRIAAVEVLAGRRTGENLLALLSCAVDPERALRSAAMEALAGWPDEGVHLFMVAQLERSAAEPGWISALAVKRHFQKVRLSSDGPAARALATFATRALVSGAWRDAARAMPAVAALPDAAAVPPLIEGLAVWIARRERGKGSARIEGEILRELQRRSGRGIGLHPDRWATWWKAARARRPTGTAMGEADAPGTRASFFGLQLPTDRTVFVVDRSGSMSAPFGTSGRSRYQEAVAQVLGFLRVQGDTARFRVILFGSGFASSSAALQPANERNLAALERWLGSRTPGGGTELRPAIEEAIALTPSGRCDLARLEADSVVVLCDGETAEGPLWVQPLLERVNGEACLVFHAVQIGGAGDGTLEALAEQTGGQHLRIAE
jgi:hypothetical protein